MSIKLGCTSVEIMRVVWKSSLPSRYSAKDYAESACVQLTKCPRLPLGHTSWFATTPVDVINRLPGQDTAAFMGNICARMRIVDRGRAHLDVCESRRNIVFFLLK